MKKGITQMKTNMVLVCMIVMVCLGSCEQPISPDVVAPPSLPAPTGLSAESDNYGEVTLEWERVENATNYQVFYSTEDDSSNVSSSPSIEPMQTSLTIDLPAGTQYYFWVKARNDTLFSQYSSSVNVTVKNTISAPTNFRVVSHAPKNITLTWDPVPTATAYEVYWTSDSNVSNVETEAKFFCLTEQNWVERGLSTDTEYYFWVRAKVDEVTSAFSDKATVTAMLPAPEGLSVSADTYGNVSLTWEGVQGATEYNVFYSETNDNSVNLTAFGSTDQTSFTYFFTAGKKYYFWVSAENSASYSLYSSSVNVEIANLPTLSTPTNFTVTSPVYGKALLTWEGIEGIEGVLYGVYISKTNDRSDSDTSYTTTDQTSITFDQLSVGEKYYFWVQASVSVGGYYETSDYSGEKSVVVANTLPVPTNFNVTSPVYGKALLTWEGIEGIEGIEYEVSYSETNDIGNATSPSFLEPMQTSLTVYNLTAGTQYYFWVRAKIDTGTGIEVASNYSDVKNVTVANTVPVPTNFNVTSPVYGKVLLTWEGVEGIGYEIFYSQINDSLNATCYTRNESTPYVMNLSTAGTHYYFWVRANVDGVTSDYSDVKNVTVANTVPVPTNFKVTSPVYGKVSLGWTGIEEVEGIEGIEGIEYEVSYSETNNNSVNITSFPSTDQTSLTVDLTASTQYYFWVKAKIGEGASDFSDVKNVTVANTIPAPTNFTATSNNYGEVTLEWEWVEGVEATGYEVFYSTTNDSLNATSLRSLTTTTLTANLPAGIEYYFWVKAKIDADIGEVTGSFSDTKSVTVKNTLSAPADFTATSNNYGEVTLQWTKVDEALVYEIHYSTDSNFANATSFSTRQNYYQNDHYMDLTAGEGYWFWIDAKAPSIMGDMSSSVNVTVQNILPAPTGFEAIQFPSGQVTLVWDAVKKATEYEVFYSIGSIYAGQTSLGSTSLTTISKNLTPNEIYYFYIQAKNSAHVGGSSSAINPTYRAYVIGDRGPGGGLIFRSGSTFYECSDNLGSANWEDAKSMAKNHRGGGYTNWYLPSGTELNYIYEDLRVPNLISENNGFWCSDVGNVADVSRIVDFSNGTDRLEYKTDDFFVFAIRALTY